MEQSRHLENKTRIRGEFKIIWEDKDGNKQVFESKNFVVNEAIDSIKDLLLGLWTGTIYRMGIGSGGYTGTTRNYPDDTWHTKTGLVSPVYSKDLDSAPSVSFQDNTWSIQSTCTFDSSELTPGSWTALTDVNEACLIVGSATSGDQESTSYMGVNDRMYSYRTFDNKAFVEGTGTTLQIVWTVFIEKV